MPSFEPVVALKRGLEILRVVNSLGVASIAEVQRRTQLHRATVVRMLETLEDAGYVSRQTDSARFVPTGRTLQLSSGYRAHERLGQIAEPVLGAIRERLGWPSVIAVPDRVSMLVVHSTRAFGGIALNGRVGTHATMLGSSLGRAYLANCSDEIRERTLTLLRSASSDPYDQKWLANRVALDLDLDEAREHGYALADQTYTRSIYNDSASGFAVPVLCNGQVIASINIVFFLAALPLADAIATFVPELREAARQIGDALAMEQETTAHEGTRSTLSKRAPTVADSSLQVALTTAGPASFDRSSEA